MKIFKNPMSLPCKGIFSIDTLSIEEQNMTKIMDIVLLNWTTASFNPILIFQPNLFSSFNALQDFDYNSVPPVQQRNYPLKTFYYNDYNDNNNNTKLLSGKNLVIIVI